MAEKKRPVDNPARVEFWESRYRSGEDGWDLGGPAPQFVSLLSSPGAPGPGALISLGCGRGHDALLFARYGFTVTGVDFSPLAIRDAREAARAAGLEAEFIEQDLFALPSTMNGRFDYVLEHTCFAAIPPYRRADYVEVVRNLLKPGGLYIAVFFAHGEWGGPPYSTHEEEVRSLFLPYFVIERLERSEVSVPRRAGKELFALMRPGPAGVEPRG